jgi:hypothetical protein
MKSIEELKSLYEEMEAAYQTALNPTTPLETITVAYAKKCRDDAKMQYKIAQIELEDIKSGDFK